MNRDRPSLDVRESPSLRLPQMMNRLATLHWHISICVATSNLADSYLRLGVIRPAESILQLEHRDIYSTHDAIVARAPRPY